MPKHGAHIYLECARRLTSIAREVRERSRDVIIAKAFYGFVQRDNSVFAIRKPQIGGFELAFERQAERAVDDGIEFDEIPRPPMAADGGLATKDRELLANGRKAPRDRSGSASSSSGSSIDEPQPESAP